MGASKGALSGQPPETTPSSSNPSPRSSQRVVLLYELGATEPTLVVPENTTITKSFLCLSFNESWERDVHIYCGPEKVKTFANDRNSGVILPPGSYTFESQLPFCKGLPGIEMRQNLMKEMMEFETKKGNLRNPEMYPTIAMLLEFMEISADKTPGSKSIYYKVGAKKPTIQGLPRNPEKITICALFGESIYQDVKIFHNSVHYQTLSNCFDFMETSNSGKYVFVFKTDSIYNLSNSEIEQELKKIELKLLIEKEKPSKENDRYDKETLELLKNAPQNPEGEIVLFGFGEPQSKKVLFQRGIISKKYICSIFKRPLRQEVHIFSGPTRVHTFPEKDETDGVFLDYDEYVVVFHRQVLEHNGLIYIQSLLSLMNEMMIHKTLKGDIRCEKLYPGINAVIRNIEQKTKEWASSSAPRARFFGAESSTPIFEGYGEVMKIVLCALLDRSFYQEIKIFRNSKFYGKVSNIFEYVNVNIPGKYVVVFESDEIYHMPVEMVEWQLLMEQEEEQRKDGGKDENKAIVTPSEGEVLIYGYGCLEPKLTIEPSQLIDKYILSIAFDQKQDQRMYIFANAKLLAPFPANMNSYFRCRPGQYTVIFEKEIQYSQEHTEGILGMLQEMILWERARGNLRSKDYPVCCTWIEKTISGTRMHAALRIAEIPSIFGVGDKEPTICGLKRINKTFKTDAIYNKTADEIGEVLRRMDMKVARKEAKKLKKPKAKNKKKTKKKPQRNLAKSRQQETISNSNNLGQFVSSEAASEETNLKTNAEENNAHSCESDESDESHSLSDHQEPTIAVENKFASLDLDWKFPTNGGNDEREIEVRSWDNLTARTESDESPGDQDNDEDLLQRVLAESVLFEKPKIYARNRNKSFTYEPRAKIEDNEESSSYSSISLENASNERDGSFFEEIPARKINESKKGAAVVVGIHSRGLIVQTIPSSEGESEYLLLDYCSQCTSTGRCLTDVAFNVKVLHVFLKVISVATLGNDPIVNENSTQLGKKIEKRIATYALDEDTFTRGRFKRGRRDSIDEELKLKKKERKVIALIVETDEGGKSDIIRVVGPPSHLSFLAQLDKTGKKGDFRKEQFIMADSFQADPFFKLHIMFGTLCLIKSYQAEQNFNHLARKMANLHMELQKCLRVEETDPDSILLKNFPHTSDLPNGDVFLFNIEKLTKNEKYLIKTCCKEMAIEEKKQKKKRNKKKKNSPAEEEEIDPDEKYNLFRLYIRDPALSICRFNSYAAYKSSQLYTIRARAQLIVDKGELRLLIILGNDQVNQILGKNQQKAAKNVWVEGSQLKIFNPVLEREKQTRFGLFVKSDADVVIDEIQIQRVQVPKVGKNGQPVTVEVKRARVLLRPAKNSKDVFNIIQEFQADFYKEFSQIGPAARDGASEALASGLLKFKNYYRHPRFFNWWRGYHEGPENVDYLQNLQERVEIPNGQNPREPFRLDLSQSTAFQHSYHRKGITSIAAGPGSGKTLLSGGLISKCYSDRKDERMIVTASTNQGVANAVEKVAKLSPGFPITREMSKRGEDAVSEDLLQYSLQYQSLESEQSHPILLRVRKEYRKVLAYYNNARTLRQKLNRLELLHFAESKVKRTYLRTVVPFCGASTPALLVRHADHYNCVINDENNGKHRLWPIKHMIVDEASQLPYYTSLALCCSYPNLEGITIMGDRMQLGPHCVLQNTEGLLSDLCRLSELDRINGLRTVEEFSLRMNYRSHNWIVENFEQPHYGSNFLSGLKPDARMMAYNLDLPLFKIRSKNSAKPVAFIDINMGDDCHNASERAGVLKLLELLMGRENDVIIVCTTKTVGVEGKYYPGLFKFVADPRRGLVAVSRAREAMYIFGQWKYLQKTAFWENKVDLMKREHLLFDENFNEI